MKAAVGHTVLAVAEGTLIAVLVLGTLGGASVAAKGPGGGGTAPSGGSCSVTPNPVAVGANWTMTGAGLPASTFVDIYDSDAVSTTVWMAQTSSSGTVSITWHSYNVGTSTITITTANTKKTSTLATCSFAVN